MEHKDKLKLNLPRTDFAMKADLVTREPQRLEKWEKADLYGKIQAARAGAPKFVLHDGPPFANGDVHIGTALNKILKDIIVKYKTLRGFSAPYIPGWDCHGLPIEFKVSQEMRKDGKTDADPATIRKACEAYARKYIDLQRVQFKRLGVLGDWQNPYLTLNKEYEADELRLFADIVAKGFIYRGKKPVYWSIPCRTALAEAEVEYKNHISESIYVKFEIKGLRDTFVLVWTTTPWTLPANLAIAYNPRLEYVSIAVKNELYIIAKDLQDQIATKCQWSEYEFKANVPSEFLNRFSYKHPFIGRSGRFYEAEFVENKTGTGFVHIAPGHGREDYLLGQMVSPKLSPYSPVDDNGRLCVIRDFKGKQMPEELVGKSTLDKPGGSSEASIAVIELLKKKRRLLHRERYEHSYPHCWRSKTPIIFRAMDQWFLEIDHILAPPGVYAGAINVRTGVKRFPGTNTFRQIALTEIDNVHWVPEWGVKRIKGAVQSRPDWCISRQRSWGVPIPAFYDAQGGAILHKDVICNVANLIEQHGSNVWFEKSADELWSLVRPTDWKGPEATAKSSDTLDVWIDSGSSSRAVIARRPEIRGHDKPFQADVYLEGSDQHRGWFQSSLLLSLAGNGAAPYKTVLTHGFMVDADREKISKSKQEGYEKPQTAEAYIKKYGADVVRLWVASQDYRDDIVVSEERINKVGETYRGIRNALRYQLSNLYDFDPSEHTIPNSQLTGLDRQILAKFSKLEKEVIEAYDKYEFHIVYQKISQFVAVELSAIYHDVIKDRMYTDPANSLRRRSTQTTLYRLVTGLCQMLAPMLAYTADEAWESLPGKMADSVHESKWEPDSFEISQTEEERWKNHFGIRAWILPKLEEKRREGAIGKSLDAKIIIRLPETNALNAISGADGTQLNSRLLIPIGPSTYAYFELDETFAEELKELLNVSQLSFETFRAKDLIQTEQATADVNNYIFVRKADGQKCERCWHWELDIGQNAQHQKYCGRCVRAVSELPSNMHEHDS